MCIRNLFVPCFAILLAQSACVLGDEGVALSPYETAYFDEIDTVGVADGLTPVSVLVHGEPGATLTLTARSATFLGSPEQEAGNEQTVQLVEPDDDGRGVALVQLVSGTPGLARLSFKLAPVAVSLDIPFEPIRFLLDPPIPIELRPGAVTHQVCVYANTRRGGIALAARDGALSPEGVELAPTGESLDCLADSSEWPGAARFEWTTSEALADVELRYLGEASAPLAIQSGQLRGEVFPGYEVVFRDAELTEAWARLEVQLAYRETPSLPSSLAGAVSLGELRSVPGGLSLVGSSSGGDAVVPQTDSQGWVSLYFETPQSAALSVFATPLGGGTLHLGDLVRMP